MCPLRLVPFDPIQINSKQYTKASRKQQQQSEKYMYMYSGFLSTRPYKEVEEANKRGEEQANNKMSNNVNVYAGVSIYSEWVRRVSLAVQALG